MILRRSYSTLVLGLALAFSGAMTARVRPALAMTMTFTARDAAQLQGLNPADRVTLRFTATPEGQLLIDGIARAP
jgi:Cu/Ag efflux protein CusF